MTTNGEESGMIFRLLKATATDGAAARLGRLALPQRRPVETPNFLDITSRGSIPHLTPDVLEKHARSHGAYYALEDFVEKSVKRASPALFTAPVGDGGRRLHSYTATATDMITVMGARRHPAVKAPMGNGTTHVSIFTSTGFQTLENEHYCKAITTVLPDIAIPLADLTFDTPIPSAKRQYRMVERTEDWAIDFFRHLDPDTVLKPAGIHVFAPVLPVEYPLQWEYLNRLEDHAPDLAGLAIYNTDILADLYQHAPLASLPRLSMHSPLSPHHILRQVSMGVDLFTLPFLNGISDEGVALSFKFPPPSSESGEIHPLGINMWPKEQHRTSLEPLVEGCSCYACTKHHRAFLTHLLDAKEMLAWTLLQIHNHHVLSLFFEGIRSAIEDGSFEEAAQRFARVYDSELPYGTGERPRARGYHFKSEFGQPKINQAPWRIYGVMGEDKALAGERAGLVVTGPSGPGAETPVVPEGDASELEKGFAEIDRST